MLLLNFVRNMVFSCITDLIEYFIGCQKSEFPINELPTEILLEIFYKLPFKQLHQNKTVCKLWSSLISSPSFPSQFSLRRNQFSPTFTMFLTHHNRKNCIHTKHLTNERDKWFEEKEDPFKFLPGGDQRGNDKVHCLASSNGLVLCSRTKYLCRCFYYVVNPMTKQWATLPSPPSCICFAFSGIVCYPSSEILNPSTQFKVVRLYISRLDSTDATLEIFDSTTNRWKVLKIQFSFRMSFNDWVEAIEHNGILYWECRSSDLLIAFDPNVDKCYVFPLPGSFNDNVDHHLGVSQNRLFYTEIDFRPGYSNPSTIWRFYEFGGKHTWIVHCHFDLYDWTLQQSSIWGNNKHIDLRKSSEHRKVLGIDPGNCNILYLILNRLRGCNDYKRLIYSVDIGRRMMKKLSSADYIRWNLRFVEPSWPTAIVPKLPPLSPDDDLYKDTHSRDDCMLCPAGL